jgi:hypothetical protein
MPFVHDTGYVLSARQENLRKDLLSSYVKMKEILYRFNRWARQDPLNGYRIGWVLSENIGHQVNYVPNYGVVCSGLVTTNGSAWTLASACMDDAVWKEDLEEIKLDE